MDSIGRQRFSPHPTMQTSFSSSASPFASDRRSSAGEVSSAATGTGRGLRTRAVMGKLAEADPQRLLIERIEEVFEEVSKRIEKDDGSGSYTFEDFALNFDPTDAFTKRMFHYLVTECMQRNRRRQRRTRYTPSVLESSSLRDSRRASGRLNLRPSLFDAPSTSQRMITSVLVPPSAERQSRLSGMLHHQMAGGGDTSPSTAAAAAAAAADAVGRAERSARVFLLSSQTPAGSDRARDTQAPPEDDNDHNANPSSPRYRPTNRERWGELMARPGFSEYPRLPMLHPRTLPSASESNGAPHSLWDRPGERGAEPLFSDAPLIRPTGSLESHWYRARASLTTRSPARSRTFSERDERQGADPTTAEGRRPQRARMNNSDVDRSGSLIPDSFFRADSPPEDNPTI